jgi:dUTP pyrophosphatase
MKQCEIKDCTKQSEKRNMCGMHYQRFQRHGDPFFVSPDWRTGRQNPNCRHKEIDDNFFEKIDTKSKAYILGFVAADGSIKKDKIVISVHQKDKELLYTIRDILKSGPLKKFEKIQKSGLVSPMIKLDLCSTKVAEDIARHLKIPTGVKKDRIVQFPDLDSEELKWAFLRGYFDGDGSIRKPTSEHRGLGCSIASYSANMLESVKNLTKTGRIKNNQINWYSVNALDLLGKLYDDRTFLRMSRKYDIYLDWCLYQPTLFSRPFVDKIFYSKLNKDALPLLKHNASDSGYDIAIINKFKEIGDVTLYGTGLNVRPPFGYYFDLIPRSSIIKSGYALANSIGVIDRAYIGEILVPLRKTNPNAKDLELPIRLVQLVLRPIINVEFVEVDSLEDTSRGSGGFGSTGVK